MMRSKHALIYIYIYENNCIYTHFYFHVLLVAFNFLAISLLRLRFTRLLKLFISSIVRYRQPPGAPVGSGIAKRGRYLSLSERKSGVDRGIVYCHGTRGARKRTPGRRRGSSRNRDKNVNGGRVDRASTFPPDGARSMNI